MQLLCSLILLLLVQGLQGAGETITITNPSEGSTSNAEGLSISGTTSVAMATVRLSLDNTIIAYVTASGGNWGYSYTNRIPDGDHSVIAEIIDTNLAVLAFDINLFTVQNNPWIDIISPQEGETFGTLLPEMIYGNSSTASVQVRITVDSTVVGTFSTDSNGSWQAPYPGMENGSHTLLVELLNPGVVASDTVHFSSSDPLTLPFGAHNLQIVHGIVPADDGTGSGMGFSYSVSSGTATITFDRDFATIPTVLVTGQGAAPSTVVTTVSTTTLTIDFSDTIDTIHFIAAQMS
jgi:hypothetical protein